MINSRLVLIFGQGHEEDIIQKRHESSYSLYCSMFEGINADETKKEKESGFQDGLLGSLDRGDEIITTTSASQIIRNVRTSMLWERDKRLAWTIHLRLQEKKLGDTSLNNHKTEESTMRGKKWQLSMCAKYRTHPRRVERERQTSAIRAESWIQMIAQHRKIVFRKE